MTIQREIKTHVPLFNDEGTLNAGWANKMLWDYDKKMVKSSGFSLKQWDFYQIRFGDDWHLQLSIVDIGYTLRASAIIMNTKENFSIPINIYKPLNQSIKMSNSPEEIGNLSVEENGFNLRFDTLEDYRRLRLKADDKGFGRIECDIKIPTVKNNTFSTAIPFENEKNFFLTCKSSFFDVSGYCLINEQKITISNAYAIMDWGRGLWPSSVKWFWCTGIDHLNNNTQNLLSFNLGWGFGKYDFSNDDIYFIDSKPVKLSKTRLCYDPRDVMQPTRIFDDSGKFDITITPFFTHENKTQVGPLSVDYKQYHAKGQGFVLDGNKKISFENFPLFFEIVKNRW